eukprot:CAMPEP_0172483666 /NCGR_PEP_ID=MMETSP1066-20121228/10726_1 /TAXON_ID=671091 /ORGANISM="Coscinodiscus wailesii, Strain CCMP2513" /LENGTH=427 /DNA_ID=CAMNT_0013247667 /DNA_START=325 /DNA_END=1604 /DNA_ORIENTATION=+
MDHHHQHLIDSGNIAACAYDDGLAPPHTAEAAAYIITPTLSTSDDANETGMYDIEEGPEGGSTSCNDNTNPHGIWDDDDDDPRRNGSGGNNNGVVHMLFSPSQDESISSTNSSSPEDERMISPSPRIGTSASSLTNSTQAVPPVIPVFVQPSEDLPSPPPLPPSVISATQRGGGGGGETLPSPPPLPRYDDTPPTRHPRPSGVSRSANETSTTTTSLRPPAPPFPDADDAPSAPVGIDAGVVSKSVSFGAALPPPPSTTTDATNERQRGQQQQQQRRQQQQQQQQPQQHNPYYASAVPLRKSNSIPSVATTASRTVSSPVFSALHSPTHTDAPSHGNASTVQIEHVHKNKERSVSSYLTACLCQKKVLCLLAMVVVYAVLATAGGSYLLRQYLSMPNYEQTIRRLNAEVEELSGEVTRLSSEIDELS